MKSLLCLLSFGIAGALTAQNVGIGTLSPVSALHVADDNSHVFTIENTDELNVNVTSGLNFTNGINGANNFKYTGAIRTIGLNTTEARMGLFTYAASGPDGLVERITILDNGKVGIGNTNPLYSLSVSGNTYISTYMGIQTPPSSSYALSVVGNSRFYNNLTVDGTVTSSSSLSVGSNLSVTGSMTVSNGKGIVRSVSSTQMKVKRGTVSFNATNFSAGGTLESGYLYFGEDYSSVTVIVGDVTTGTGDWPKVLLVPFDVDTANDRCKFKLTNASTASITFTGTWEVVMIGN